MTSLIKFRLLKYKNLSQYWWKVGDILESNTGNQSCLTLFKLNFCEHNPQFSLNVEAIKKSVPQIKM